MFFILVVQAAKGWAATIKDRHDVIYKNCGRGGYYNLRLGMKTGLFCAVWLACLMFTSSQTPIPSRPLGKHNIMHA